MIALLVGQYMHSCQQEGQQPSIANILLRMAIGIFLDGVIIAAVCNRVEALV